MADIAPLIHVLAPHIANQIAAGEVVERPASAVKELMENSLDAGATQIRVRMEDGGKKRIEVDDDGYGMSAVDAALALQRHATSKIETSDDLHRIASHGFRGEALPSIASVSRFRLWTCARGADEGVEVSVHGGLSQTVKPAASRQGSKIEVLDLFLNTPARLHFMRTTKTEEAATIEVFKGLALAHPEVAMRLELDGRKRFDFRSETASQRVMGIMGKEFSRNALEHAIEHEGIQVSAHVGLPTFHHRDASRMIFLLNGRVIRDKQLIAALRAGYRDVMFHDRYPVAVMRLEMDPAAVDVNVHPAKREVRFVSPQKVRAAVVACVRSAIECMGQHVADTTTQQAMQSLNPSATSEQPAPTSTMPNFTSQQSHARPPQASAPHRVSSGRSFSPTPAQATPAEVQALLFRAPEGGVEAHEAARSYDATPRPLQLGTALAQVHRCYILSQTDEGLILVDQHAAHERIRYEQCKAQQLGAQALASQLLLTPMPLPCSDEMLAWLHEHAADVQRFGVDIRVQDDGAQVYSVPALLADEEPQGLVLELLDACMLLGVDAEAGATGLGRILERWLGNRACKGSIKSGRVLQLQEQEHLLREMEQTPNIAQCNHGRPTYVRLSLHDLDRLFGRKE